MLFHNDAFVSITRRPTNNEKNTNASKLTVIEIPRIVNHQELQVNTNLGNETAPM